MIDKRFTFDEDVYEDDMYEMGVFSDNGRVMETMDILNCLNNFHEESEQLKQFKTVARKLNIPFDKLGEVFEKSIDWDCETDCKINAIQLTRENEQLRDENEQLKQEIKELKEKNENLLVKLKYTCEQINYSERLRKVMK